MRERNIGTYKGQILQMYVWFICVQATHYIHYNTGTTFTRELCCLKHFSLAEILVMAGGAIDTIPPAPVVPARTRISARLKGVGDAVHA